MKKLTMTVPLLAMIFTFVAGIAMAQTTSSSKADPATEDYFMGKWTSVISGIPQGEAQVIIAFEKKDGKIAGSLTDPAQNVVSDFRDVKVENGKLTLMFTSQGYDVSLTLEKKDADNLAGFMMDQFPVTGSRVK